MNCLFIFGCIFLCLFTRNCIAVKIDVGKVSTKLVTEIAVTEELLPITTVTEMITKSTTVSSLTSTAPSTTTSITESRTTTTVRPITAGSFLSHKRSNNVRPKNITSSDYYCFCDLMVRKNKQMYQQHK